MIDADLLRRMMPRSGERADVFAPHLEAARARFVGDDPAHVAMWLAQLAHESGELRYVREIASGEAYEGRRDLGNTEPGDGPRFRGRGLIQLTGRDNYRRAGAALSLPLLERPELLEQPEHASAVSGWFWQWADCSALMVAADPALAVTRRINGGINGLDARRAYYETAVRALADHLAAQLTAAPIVESTPVIVKEAPMSPIVAAVLPSIVQAIPELSRVFGSGSEVAQRNTQAAERVVEIVTTATQAVNAQQAAERVAANPEHRQAAQQAVRAEYYDLLELAGFDERSRTEARSFAERMTGTGPEWRQIGYGLVIAALAVAIVVGGGSMLWSLMLNDGVTGEQKGMILGALLAAFGTVVSYFFGSSLGSKNSGDAVRRIAERH